MDSAEDYRKKLSLKPYLDSLAKKNLVEESVAENDATINNIASACDDTDRIFKTTDIDDQKVVPAPSSRMSTKKEKTYIKDLLKEIFNDANIDLGYHRGKHFFLSLL